MMINVSNSSQYAEDPFTNLNFVTINLQKRQVTILTKGIPSDCKKYSLYV